MTSTRPSRHSRAVPTPMPRAMRPPPHAPTFRLSGPDATGRRRLVGCCRSASTSTASLMKYVPDATAQNTAKATRVRTSGVGLGQDAGGAGCGEHQQVFWPLPDPGRAHQGQQDGRLARVLWPHPREHLAHGSDATRAPAQSMQPHPAGPGHVRRPRSDGGRDRCRPGEGWPGPGRTASGWRSPNRRRSPDRSTPRPARPSGL